MTWNMLTMQDPGTMSMTYMAMTHDIIMEVITLLTISIFIIMTFQLKNKLTNRTMTQSHYLEIAWTVLPMITLIYMASPSLQLLYILEEMLTPSMTVKAMGHQWYWSYEYPDFMKTYDSFMSIDESINKFRSLDVDNRLILPLKTNTRILCSSMDVIHSWAIPSLGLKMDALPGRVNQTLLYSMFAGLYFGQCSEICGTNHSFMPIVAEIIPVKMFTKWIEQSPQPPTQ